MFRGTLLHAVRVKLVMERKHEKTSLRRQDVAAIQGKELKKRYPDEAKRLQLSVVGYTEFTLQTFARKCTSK